MRDARASFRARSGTGFILCLLCSSAVLGGAQSEPDPVRPHPDPGSASHLLAHFDRLVPDALEATGVPGAAVGLITGGEITALRGYGFADVARRRPVTRETVFNVGSVSKVPTAWAAMRLVTGGRLDLDRPVGAYLAAWPLPDSPFDEDKITLRRLLSHTAGLSMDAVPEYEPGTPVPSTADALGHPESGVRIVSEPGTEWSYSGGGYMLLQLLIEEVTGRPFDAYVREAVFEPLGMDASAFSWTPALRKVAATPYDEGEPVGYFRYAGQAAAALNTTVADLARFAAAALGAESGEGSRHRPGRDVLSPEAIALMQSPAPATEQQWGVRSGLGYQIWGLHDRWAVDDRHPRMMGHAGQNTGWASILWVVPETGDGLVVLTNASDGRALWRWILCDWAQWISGTTYLGLCTDRPAALPPGPGEREVRHPLVDSLVQRHLRVAAKSFPEFLAGDLTFRGDAWPVELTTGAGIGDGPAGSAEVDEAAEAAQPETRLTLPDLVYADEAVQTRREGDAVVVTLPFGLGDYALESEDGSYVARVALGADTAVLRLRPADPPVVRRSVGFETDDASLAGTLHLPATAGPHPAVVVVPGSGEMGRSTWAYRSWGDAFARRGVAALVYDKRGVGESTGDFRRDSAFVGLAADARAAAAYLRALPEIDPTRIGLAGWSQGGWVQLRAAAEDDSVAFLAMLSPAAFTPPEQEMQSVEARMRRAGFTEAEIADARAYTRLYFYVAATGRGWSRLEAETARLPDLSWAGHVQWPERPEDLAWWRRHMRVEPALYVPEIEAPVIAFFGGADPVVPAPANAGRLRELLAARPDCDSRVLTAPGADHRLEVPAGPDASGQWRFPRIAPVVLDSLDRWLDDHVLRGSGGR